MDREVMKVESSIPVQGRISIVTLAELELYWRSEGVEIKSMSQLLAWSMGVLREVLVANGKLPRVIETVSEAHQYLLSIGIYQPGMRKKGVKKISNALAFESMRMEGVEPRDYANRQFNAVHNRNSVEVYEERGIRPDVVKLVNIYKSTEAVVKEKMSDEEFEDKMRDIEKGDVEKMRKEKEELDRLIIERTENEITD